MIKSHRLRPFRAQAVAFCSLLIIGRKSSKKTLVVNWGGIAILLTGITGIIARKSVLADWALSQGMYITGSESPFEFYQNLSYHNLSGVTHLITQDVLLLAGEKDHYIPLNQFYRLKNALPHARSLSCRLFTRAEGGEQHCQVGNHMLFVQTIIDWLSQYFSNAL